MLCSREIKRNKQKTKKRPHSVTFSAWQGAPTCPHALPRRACVWREVLAEPTCGCLTTVKHRAQPPFLN